MKKFLQSKLFKLVLSAVVGICLFFFTPICLSKMWLGIIIGSLFLITNLSQYISRVAFVTHFFRIFVGGLFIFSGTIKSNDPTGFSIKLKEYFEIFTGDVEGTWLSFLKGLFEYCHDHSVGLSILVCVIEVACGFMLLIGFKKMFTLWLLILQIVFFTFLTFYSACYNKVTHCGCFGDFLVLTPWTSFTKDIILLVSIAFLFAGKDNIKPLFKKGFVNWGLTGLAIAFSIWFPFFCYNNLPVWDFLPFKNGTDICKAMEKAPDYKPAKYMSYFKYKNLKTGESKSFDQDHMPWQDTLTWKYVDADGEPVLVSKEVGGAKISSYSLVDFDGNVISDSLLQSKKRYFLLVCWELKSMEKNAALIKKINEFSTACEKEGVKFLAITHDDDLAINKFKFDNQALFNFARCDDDVTLKMMIRSNPGLMLFNGCTMVRKWHHNNFAAYSDVKDKYFK
ncbi:MAG: DoxX family membrane protein [Bacteroidia bacterium]|nr:DoxX family membrane protein [Bacteroidia bacterium]